MLLEMLAGSHRSLLALTDQHRSLRPLGEMGEAIERARFRQLLASPSARAVRCLAVGDRAKRFAASVLEPNGVAEKAPFGVAVVPEVGGTGADDRVEVRRRRTGRDRKNRVRLGGGLGAPTAVAAVRRTVMRRPQPALA